jgi:SAM-dependent methyltransferase
MTQAKKRQLLPSHYRILDQINLDPDKNLSPKDLKDLEGDYRWGAPGVSDDPSMIDFFDTPRSTLFEGLVRVWNCAYLAALYSGILKESKVAEIVDVGAGRAETLRVLKSIRLKKGARFNYSALDIDLRKREVFKLLYPNDASKYLIHDFREGLPFKDSSVDCFISTEVIEHVTEDEGRDFLREAFRCLKKGGHFIGTTPNGSQKNTAASVYHAIEWESDAFREALCEAGFNIVEYFGMGVSLRTLGSLVPKNSRNRICTDLLRATLGPASGLEGNVICWVCKKGE